jgi:hypothetical protein
MHETSSIESESQEPGNSATSAAAEFGRLGGLKGGKARARALSSEDRRAIARAAADARWSNRSTEAPPRATHTGTVRIGQREIECGVLEDGTRVLTRATFIRAIGRTGKAKGGRKYDAHLQLPVFLTAENLRPFIPPELLENSTPISILYKGVRALGYKAELLADVCQVFIDAKDAGVLRANQMPIAEACKLLYRGFAKLGIVALVDEATGYQESRADEALQQLLDLYLSREFATWAKTFPDEFYEEIFRLRNWKWRGRSTNPPQVVAHYTNDLVYARLAPGILKELKTRNPKVGKYRKARHPQLLTVDVGHPALAQHLHAVIAIMRASDTWNDFMQKMNRAFPVKGDKLQLEFKDWQPENAVSTNKPEITENP